MFKMNKIKVNFQILFSFGLVGLVLLMFSSYLSYFLFPSMVETKIYETKVLKEGTEQWETFLKTPFPMQFKVHLFNVNNYEDVLWGAKPVVTDLGPYVYRLYRWKEGVTFNETTDEISYYEYDKYIFDQEASGTLTDNDMVTVLNIPLINFVYKAQTMELLSAFPSWLQKGLESMFGEQSGIFLVNVTVKQFLFDGIRFCINGSVEGGMVAKMGCKAIKERLPDIRQMREDGKDILFATFHYKNNTTLGYTTVKSGQRHRNEAGFLVSFNKQKYLRVWHEDQYHCNEIKGVTTIFPPFIDHNKKFTAYSDEICRWLFDSMERIPEMMSSFCRRTLTMGYSKAEEISGIKAYKFGAEKSSFSSSKVENQCYCIKETRNINGKLECLYDGVVDLMNCTGNVLIWIKYLQ